MQILPWKTPIYAPWVRSLDLRELSFSKGRLSLLVEQEEPKQLWRLTFQTVQFFRSTTEECATPILMNLPAEGALFEVLASPLIAELGDTHFLSKAHHYIVCCYDEVIEIIAWEAGAESVDASSAVAE